MATMDREEQHRIYMAESAKLMASTDCWKLLIQEMEEYEERALERLGAYLADEPHPDREEVMTMCLKWHALRVHRCFLVRNVENLQAGETVPPDEEEFGAV